MDENNPLISVVMGYYNDPHQLEITLKSLAKQTYQNFEIIIVDDGSRQTAQSSISKFRQQLDIKLIVNKENIGLTKSLIVGCHQANGSYIARHDVGDMSHPSRLETQMAYLQQHHDIQLVFCELHLVDITFNKTLLKSQNIKQNVLDITSPNIIECPSHHGSAMFSKKLYMQCGGYREQFYYAQDLDLWLRMARLTDYKILEDIHYVATLGVNNITSKANIEQNQLKRIIIELAQQESNIESKMTCEKLLLKASNIRPADQQSQLNLKNTYRIKVENKNLVSENNADGYYFIASALLNNGEKKAARYYLLKAWQAKPNIMSKTTAKIIIKIIKSLI